MSGWDFWPLSPNRIPGKLQSSHNILRMQQQFFIVQELRTPTRHPVSSDPPCHTKCIQDRQYSILWLCTKNLKMTKNSMCKTFSFFMCRGQHSTDGNINTPTTRLGKGKSSHEKPEHARGGGLSLPKSERVEGRRCCPPRRHGCRDTFARRPCMSTNPARSGLWEALPP